MVLELPMKPSEVICSRMVVHSVVLSSAEMYLPARVQTGNVGYTGVAAYRAGLGIHIELDQHSVFNDVISQEVQHFLGPPQSQVGNPLSTSMKMHTKASGRLLLHPQRT